MDSALFIKTKQIYEEYILLNKKTELRNKLSNELIQVTKKEVKNQLKSAADLDQLKEKMQAENKTDICWITENERYASARHVVGVEPARSRKADRRGAGR